MQELLPKPPSPSRRLLARQQQLPEQWLPGQKLCAVLSDMREARQKQLDVAEALRAGVPRTWWGAPVGSGQPKLGSHLQIIQVLHTLSSQRPALAMNWTNRVRWLHH